MVACRFVGTRFVGARFVGTFGIQRGAAIVIAPKIYGLVRSFALSVALAGCSSDTVDPGPPQPTRTWEMGFYFTPPRVDLPIALQNIDLFSARAELAVLHEELPWDLLLAGTDLDAVVGLKDGLVAYLRGKRLRIFYMADLTDGLSRGEEPPLLRAAGRSITEPDVQQLYRQYVRAFVERFQPDYIGLTAETNLVRAAAAPAVYASMVTAANAVAADLLTAGVTTPLLISVQVETAWGRLGGTGPYLGVEQDFADFPFTQMLGLSSYPYFGYAQPEDIPDDYYARLANGRALPAIVCEGGWASAGVGAIASSPELQARYLARQAVLLDSVEARAVVQTLFTDLDLDSLTEPYPDNLPLFSSLGLMQLVNDGFVVKPALTVWDGLFARRRI